jgi:hypothetical protein
MMGAANTSEIPVNIYQTTQQNIAEDSNLHTLLFYRRLYKPAQYIFVTLYSRYIGIIKSVCSHVSAS